MDQPAGAMQHDQQRWYQIGYRYVSLLLTSSARRR
jgi:hypothetical protein